MMRYLIGAFGDQLVRGAALARLVDVPSRRLISCGMGGSAVAGEFLSMLRDDVVVHWDYDLPVGAGPQDLVVCTSWSGNTEEVLSSYERAVALGATTLAITTGGELAALAPQHKTPLVMLPFAPPPPA